MGGGFPDREGEGDVWDYYWFPHDVAPASGGPKQRTLTRTSDPREDDHGIEHRHTDPCAAALGCRHWDTSGSA